MQKMKTFSQETEIAASTDVIVLQNYTQAAVLYH